MSYTRLFGLTVAQLRTIDKIKDDPCYTTNVYRIKACEKEYIIGTIITPDLHHTHKFFVRQKDFSKLTERVLEVRPNGEISIYNKDGISLKEDVTAYLFCDQAYHAVKQLEKNGFHNLTQPEKHRDVFTLERKYQISEKVLELPKLKASVTAASARCLVQVNRKGNLAIFYYINGTALSDPKRSIKHQSTISTLQDIPDQQMRDCFQKVIEPLLSATKNSGGKLRARL